MDLDDARTATGAALGRADQARGALGHSAPAQTPRSSAHNSTTRESESESESAEAVWDSDITWEPAAARW